MTAAQATKAFIEVQFPIGPLSLESYKERRVSHGKVLTLGKWWGEKPLVLTRAIILITRQLVYATVDFIASDEKEASADSLYFLAFSELADLFQEAVVWASYVIGVEHAQELFNLEG